MKKIFFVWCMFLCLLLSACSSATPETVDATNSTTATVEVKVVARVVLNGKSADVLNVLCSDGSHYREHLVRGDKFIFLQKGDTILIQNNKIYDVRFCL